MGGADSLSWDEGRGDIGRVPSTNGFHSDGNHAPPMDRDRSDEELMSQLAAGRPEALGPLHGRYASLVFGLAARSLDRATAEEITQEVFLTVWQKAATFDPARGTFRAWVVADHPHARAQRAASSRPEAPHDVGFPGHGGGKPARLRARPRRGGLARASPRRRAGGRGGPAAAPARGVEPGLPRRPDQRAGRRLPQIAAGHDQEPDPGRPQDACASSSPRWSRWA